MIQFSRETFAQHARNVLDETATRNVRHALHGDGFHQLEQRLHVDARGRHQGVGERAAVEVGGEVRLCALDDLAHEREAVRVDAARGETQHHVARGDRAAVDDLALFDRAHRETGQVVFAVGVHARHFGRFTADQRAARQLAALCDALHDRGRRIDVQLAAGEVVEEEQRLGALHENVVHAHRDEILADRVVFVQMKRETQLGAHAVGARDEYGLLVLLRHFEERAESADAAHHAFAQGLLRKRLDAIDERVARDHVDASVGVGEALILISGAGFRLIHGEAPEGR